MQASQPGAQLYEQLRHLLPTAQAESCQVVATFLDIRGFSTFSAGGESFDAALYLRSVFTTVLTQHFPDANYFKPTGDGLMLIHELPTDPTQLGAMVTSILSRSLDLVERFSDITKDDVMVNFPVPAKVGFGVARGSVTRLVSNGIVLDYTGRCLNLSARLMDKARPCGVVFADRHAANLIGPDLADSFTEDRVCIRGISEQEPIPILVSADVCISPFDREPIPESKMTWGDAQRMSVSDVRTTSIFMFYLPRAPRSFERAGVHVEYPTGVPCHWEAVPWGRCGPGGGVARPGAAPGGGPGVGMIVARRPSAV